ncbi:tyrosine-type recombinase/integrase [Streptococcus iniae]|nr:site-specific integrase [Streptococcus iniae]
MATYRQRGKKKTWDYRVYDKNKNVIATGSGFRTKKEAIYEAEAIERKKQLGSIFTSKQTLFELWQEWYNLVIAPSSLDELTKLKYQARGKIIKLHLSYKPAIYLSHVEYQRFIRDYGENVTKNLMTCINSDIKKVIKFVKRDGFLIKDFTEGVVIFGELYKKAPEDKYIKSIEDYNKISYYLKSVMDYDESIIPFFIYTMLKTGFRFGEAMAMTWNDIDFELGSIYTYRRYSSVKKKFTKPKTKTSIRRVPISNNLKKVLLNLKKQQSEKMNSLGIKNEEGLVFYDYRFGMISNNAVNKYLTSILKSLQIDTKMTSTGARHTYGSYLLAKGVDIWLVSKLMGHKDIQELIRTYGHLMREVEISQQKLVVDILDA